MPIKQTCDQYSMLCCPYDMTEAPVKEHFKPELLTVFLSLLLHLWSCMAKYEWNWLYGVFRWLMKFIKIHFNQWNLHNIYLSWNINVRILIQDCLLMLQAGEE